MSDPEKRTPIGRIDFKYISRFHQYRAGRRDIQSYRHYPARPLDSWLLVVCVSLLPVIRDIRERKGITNCTSEVICRSVISLSPTRTQDQLTYMKIGYVIQRSSTRDVWDDLHMGNLDSYRDILAVSAGSSFGHHQLTYCYIG